MRNFEELTVEGKKESVAVAGGFDLDGLIDLAAAALPAMYNPQRRMFCHRMIRVNGSFVQDGVSPRYTAMTLLGLHRLEAAGGRSPIPTGELLSSLTADYSWINNLGNLGLLLWVCAKLCPERFESVYQTLGADTALERFPEARERHTMDLSWFLSGLAHGALALPAKHGHFEPLALRTYEALKQNQGKSGFFGHQSGNGAAGFWRGRIGSFADQAYPIYAGSRLAQAYEIAGPLEMASECAAAICSVQGTLGQWWWHYDSKTGRVIQKYPVYSVHQDGMAPMALLALTEASDRDLSSFVYKGLRWITGQNELQLDMRDAASKMIWRNIYRQGSSVYIREFWEFLTSSHAAVDPHRLNVLQECRPYHLGWLLYAFAPNGSTSSQPGEGY